MKKLSALLFCLLLATAMLVACGGDTPDAETDTTPETAPSETVSETVSETQPETLPETEPETASPYAPVDPATLTADKTYDNDHGSYLSAYADKTAEDYEGMCVYYEQAGYELYSENSRGGNHFSTYRKGAAMAHVYWLEADRELNIVLSETNGDALPPQDGGAAGSEPVTVTQLQQLPSETSGMAYIIRLSDGSFIVYDGGYTTTIDQLLSELKRQNGGDGNIHIRAWLLTHSHDDHITCFRDLALRGNRYLNAHDMTLTLDTLILSPISNEQALAMDDDGNFYANQLNKCIEKFEGTKVCYAHTGMTMQFAGLQVEFLYTGDDLFIDGSTGYFNDSTMITRICSTQADKGETLSMVFLGDAGSGEAERLLRYYGDTLKTDMCQISHHGVEDFPLAAYEKIAASILFYPCNNWLYALTDRDADVREALRESEVTKEILLRDNDLYTRYLDASKNPAPIGKPDRTGIFPEEP